MAGRRQGDQPEPRGLSTREMLLALLAILAMSLIARWLTAVL